ncbi:MAG: hypothetical protein ABH858_00895 [Candidatus Omnitrophota bacterium]
MFKGVTMNIMPGKYQKLMKLCGLTAAVSFFTGFGRAACPEYVSRVFSRDPSGESRPRYFVLPLRSVPTLTGGLLRVGIKISVSIFILLFSFNLPAEEGQKVSVKERIQQHYLKGKEYISKGDYLKANEEFKQAEGLLRGVQAPQRSEIAEIPAKLKVQESIPPEAKGILERIGKLRTVSNSAEIVKMYLELSEVMPDNPDVYYNLAVNYLRGSHYWRAHEALKEVIRLNPDDKDACYNLAVLNESYIGDKNLAVSYYKKYLELDPQAKDKSSVESWIESLQKRNDK